MLSSLLSSIYVDICGITLATVIVAVGAGGNFLLDSPPTLQLILAIGTGVFFLIALAYPFKDEFEYELLVSITLLVYSFLGLLLTPQGLYAIYLVQPKGLVGFSYFGGIYHVMIIKFILDCFLVVFGGFDLFRLHLNMMVIPPPPKNQHQLQHFDV